MGKLYLILKFWRRQKMSIKSRWFSIFELFLNPAFCGGIEIIFEFALAKKSNSMHKLFRHSGQAYRRLHESNKFSFQVNEAEMGSRSI